MIAFSCPACQKRLTVKDELAGKRGKCPGCQQPLLIPKDAALHGSPSHGKPSVASTRPPDSIPAAPAGSSPAKDRPATQSLASSEDATLAPLRPAQDVSREDYDFLAPPQSPDELGRLGPYRVLHVLGAGGMGVVFRAEDPLLKRLVAIKAMLPGLAATPSAKQRFLREAQAAAALKHDHLVTIYQVGEDRGVPFLAMEFLEGEPLDQRLQRQTILPVTEVLRIGREMAEGLAAAHTRGLIHRDIKPANVWLEGEKGRVKILDFGLARSMADEAHLTQSGVIVGTPAFMAPEQAQGGEVGPHSDLFSLGCVLYRLATGQAPFKGKDTISTLVAVATEEPAAPKDVNPTLPQSLSDLVMKLLAKDPAQRIASAQEVVEALRAIEADLAGGPSATFPAAKAATAQKPRASVTTTLTAQPAGVAPRGRWLWPVVGVCLAVFVLGLGAYLLAKVLRVDNAKGTLVVEVNDPNVLMTVKQDGISLYDKVKDRTFTVNAGDGIVEVYEKDGVVPLQTQRFTLNPGGQETVHVSLGPRTAATKTPDGEVPEVQPVAADLGAFDRLRREDIPLAKLTAAGQGNPKRAPMEIVAIFGQSQSKTPIVGFALHPDGKTLALGVHGTNRVTMVNVGTGKERAWPHPVFLPRPICFSHDGKLLAVNANDYGPASLYDAVSGTQVQALTTEPTNEGAFVAFSPDDRQVFSLPCRHFLRRQWVSDRVELGTPPPPALEKSHYAMGQMALSPDGHFLAAASVTGYEDCFVQLWDVRTGKLLGKTGDKLRPARVTFSPDSKLLAQAQIYRHDIAVFDVATRKRRGAFHVPNGETTDVAFHPRKSLAATCDCGGDIFFFDTTTFANVRILHLRPPTSKPQSAGGVRRIQFTPEGGHLLTLNGDGTVYVLRLAPPPAKAGAGPAP